jgi:S-adenosylmethionine/arginine decarboxylase-like enzyme
MEKFVPNHKHFICKGTFRKPPKSCEELNRWFIELVHKVEMVVVAGPTSVYVEEPGNEGVTGTVTLATSHSSMHVWDNEVPSMFQFDIYSCKDFSTEDVLEHLNRFGLIDVEYIRIDRNKGLVLTEHKIIHIYEEINS